MEQEATPSKAPDIALFADVQITFTAQESLQYIGLLLVQASHHGKAVLGGTSCEIHVLTQRSWYDPLSPNIPEYTHPDFIAQL